MDKTNPKLSIPHKIETEDSDRLASFLAFVIGENFWPTFFSLISGVVSLNGVVNGIESSNVWMIIGCGLAALLSFFFLQFFIWRFFNSPEIY